MSEKNPPECDVCDYEHALHVGRATWLCPACLQDISIGYMYWAEVAHPEWLDGLDAVSPPAPADPEDL